MPDAQPSLLTDRPIRIQRRRTKGWRMPENTVVVTRPGKYGNPFVVGNCYKFNRMGWLRWLDRGQRPADVRMVTDAATAVAMFREYLSQLAYPPMFNELRGKNLACWCPLDQSCHGDVLLEIANG